MSYSKILYICAEIVYTLREISIDGYSTEITGNQAGYKITNTNTEIIEIPVEKHWEGTVGKSVTIKLLADDTAIEEIMLTADSDWKHIFTNLPKYDNTDGHEILYAIIENHVPGYTSSISGDAENGFIVINKETPPPQTEDKNNISLNLWMMIISGLNLLLFSLAGKKKLVRNRKRSVSSN